VSQFFRRESPPSFDQHEKYRPFLRQDFRFVCAYCERPEAVVGGEEFFEVDHFRPANRFPEGRVYYPNLYYACGKCNRHKGSTWPSESLIEQGFRFSDPCEEDMYVTHLSEGEDGKLKARTNVGSYTCAHIRLNRPALLQWRLETRSIVEDLVTLEALRENLALQSQTVSEPGLQADFSRQIVALDSAIARLRQRSSK
jgi:hypothetical protein